MKKTLRTFIAMTALLTCALPAHACKYPAAFVVTEVDAKTDTVLLTTATGFTYAFYGIEDWEVGDLAAAILDDNGTPDIRDDRIVDVRYAGSF